jgi:hypothetical protein
VKYEFLNVFFVIPGLSIPIPKAIVAQITRTSSLIHLSWTWNLEAIRQKGQQFVHIKSFCVSKFVVIWPFKKMFNAHTYQLHLTQRGRTKKWFLKKRFIMDKSCLRYISFEISKTKKIHNSSDKISRTLNTVRFLMSFARNIKCSKQTNHPLRVLIRIYA